MTTPNVTIRYPSPAEIAELEKEQSQNPAPPTEAERLAALEEWRTDLEASYVMGVNEA